MHKCASSNLFQLWKRFFFLCHFLFRSFRSLLWLEFNLHRNYSFRLWLWLPSLLKWWMRNIQCKWTEELFFCFLSRIFFHHFLHFFVFKKTFLFLFNWILHSLFSSELMVKLGAQLWVFASFVFNEEWHRERELFNHEKIKRKEIIIAKAKLLHRRFRETKKNSIGYNQKVS